MQDSHNLSAQEMHTRMLLRVVLDDSGNPFHRDLLHHSFRRMFDSPTACRLAAQFLDTGRVATIRFAPMEGSAFCEVDGSTAFVGKRAHTLQDGLSALILVNENYLGSDDDYVLRDLPPALAHELLGHVLATTYAEKQGLEQAFHHSTLNEINARLVGWLVDLELDGRIERSGADKYLRDPAGFIEQLWFEDAYYAVSFTVEEMADVRQVMMRRLAAAFQERETVIADLELNALHLQAMEGLIQEQGFPEDEFSELRQQLEDADAALWIEREKLDGVVDLLAQTIRRCSDESDAQSETYFRNAASHPFWTEMSARVVTMSGHLAAMVRNSSINPFERIELQQQKTNACAAHQYTLEDLKTMMARSRL